jgi:DNA-binding Lrp family transcriptional regulator
VYITAGEWDLVLKVRGKSIEDIGMFIVDGIRRTPGIHTTRTVACFETVKDEA